jgi:hypothetical protein
LRSHDSRSQFDWFWWDEAEFEWFWWGEMRIKKKVVSRISLLCAHANSMLAFGFLRSPPPFFGEWMLSRELSILYSFLSRLLSFWNSQKERRRTRF